MYLYILPTAAEWEYAATGKSRTYYPWGDDSEASYDGSELTSKYNHNGVVAAEVLKNPDRIATYNNEKSDRYGEKERIGDIISMAKVARQVVSIIPSDSAWWQSQNRF